MSKDSKQQFLRHAGAITGRPSTVSSRKGFSNVSAMKRARRMQSTVTGRGQVTIPESVRKHLGLKTGDRVKFFLRDGNVVLLPMLPVSALKGFVKSRRRRPPTVDEMTKAVAEGAALRYSRAKRS